MENNFNAESGVLSIKVLVCGDASVGKSSLVRQFCDRSFTLGTQTTTGPEVSCFSFAPHELDGAPQADAGAAELFARTTVRLSVWDTPGQRTIVEATPQSLRNADAAFVCFDVCGRASFDQLSRWIDLVRRHSPSALIVVVGCKSDMDDCRVVARADVDAFARLHDAPCFETSAKNNLNVVPTFKFVAVSLRQRWFAARPARSPRSGGGGGGAPGRVRVADARPVADQGGNNGGACRC
jgi:small GTP-binding protein